MSSSRMGRDVHLDVVRLAFTQPSASLVASRFRLTSNKFIWTLRSMSLLVLVLRLVLWLEVSVFVHISRVSGSLGPVSNGFISFVLLTVLDTELLRMKKKGA